MEKVQPRELWVPFQLSQELGAWTLHIFLQADPAGSQSSEDWDLGPPHHWTVLREGDPSWSAERWQVMKIGTHVRDDREDLEAAVIYKAPAVHLSVPLQMKHSEPQYGS